MKKTETWSALAAELLYRLRVGPVRNWRWLGSKLRDAREDRQFGILSSGRRSARELGAASPEFFHYQPVSFADLREVFSVPSFGLDETFVDFGSGMGRVLCFTAVHCAFRSIIGVEVSAELCTIARQNLVRIQPRMRCRDVQVLNEDAAAFRIPAEATIFHFFNPFGASVLERVIHNLEHSVREHPRSVRLLFYGTASCAQFAALAQRYKWLQLESMRTLRTGATLITYTFLQAFEN